MSEEELDMYALQIGWLELPDLNNSQITVNVVHNYMIKWYKWTYKHNPKQLWLNGKQKNNFIEVNKQFHNLNIKALWLIILTDLSDHICGNNYIPVVYR